MVRQALNQERIAEMKTTLISCIVHKLRRMDMKQIRAVLDAINSMIERDKTL